jgi:hypothetical protein
MTYGRLPRQLPMTEKQDNLADPPPITQKKGRSPRKNQAEPAKEPEAGARAREARAREAREAKEREAKERIRRQSKNAILIAIITGLAGLGSSVITGYFQLRNVNEKIADLRPVEVLGGDWVTGGASPDWHLGIATDNGAPKGGVPDGSREDIVHVKFSEPFTSKPTVLVTVTMLDAWKDGGLKWVVSPDHIEVDGFDITIRALAHTAIYSIGGEWVAYQR